MEHNEHVFSATRASHNHSLVVEDAASADAGELGVTPTAGDALPDGQAASQTWRTFLNNHARDIVGIDFFTVPTATFRILYVLVMLDHDRRTVRHFNVTAHPSAQGTAQQINEAFPWDEAPRYLLRDRDPIYGDAFQRRVDSFGLKKVKTAPQSPWQNLFVERLIGSIRRDRIDHVIVLNEHHLRRILCDYFHYYHTSRNHLSLDKDPPVPRPVERIDIGKVVALPRVGGLHHHYTRLAA